MRSSTGVSGTVVSQSRSGVQLVQPLMGETVTEPDGCRQGRPALRGDAHLGGVLKGAACADTAESQSPASIFADVEG
jgi:hypothetical protein